MEAGESQVFVSIKMNYSQKFYLQMLLCQVPLQSSASSSVTVMLADVPLRKGNNVRKGNKGNNGNNVFACL